MYWDWRNKNDQMKWTRESHLEKSILWNYDNLKNYTQSHGTSFN